MIKAKAKEKVTATSEFAELGMKAAIAATQYARFDPDGNKRIDLVDIARVFAKVEGVTPLQAYTVAEMVMQGADRDFLLSKNKLSLIADAARNAALACIACAADFSLSASCCSNASHLPRATDAERAWAAILALCALSAASLALFSLVAGFFPFLVFHDNFLVA